MLRGKAVKLRRKHDFVNAGGGNFIVRQPTRREQTGNFTKQRTLFKATGKVSEHKHQKLVK
jgi:hypothetical protein